MIEYQSKSQEELPGTKPSIAVVGIGGAGANVLDRIALEGLTDAELISMNSDVRALANSVAPTKIQLGKMLTQGLGAGGDPDLGREAAQASMEEIRESLRGKDLVFLCSGQGGGIGSGAAPMVAQAAKEQGAFVVVFATMPFCFEGKRRLAQARESLELYRGCADALITFDNDRMGELILPKEGIQQAFAAADQIISQSIRAVTALVTQPGLIHIGMDDLIAALRNNDSRCLFGHGAAKGQNRAQEALKRALKSPLLDKGKLLEKSKNLLVHISGGESMTLYEVELLMNALEKHVPETTQILFGASSDKSLGDSLSVTLISSLTSVEMTGEEAPHDGVVTGEGGHDTSQQFAPQQQSSAAVGSVSLASGESIIRQSAPVAEHQPVAQHHQPVPGAVPQPVQRREPEIVEAPVSPPPISSPPPMPHPQAQPVSYAQPGVHGGQPSTTSGLGKSSESVQAAAAAVESARELAEGDREIDDAEVAETPELEAAVEVVEEADVAEAAVAPSDVSEEAPADNDAEQNTASEANGGSQEAIVEVQVPKVEEEVESETEEEVEAETEEEAESETEEEVESETEEEVESETEEEVESETEEEVESETEEEVESETEEEVEVESETEEEVESETEEEVEAETEEEAESETEEEVESETEEEVESETEEEVEAETEEEVEAETEEEVESETEEEVESETEEEVESETEEEVDIAAKKTAPVLVKPTGARPSQRPVVVQAKGTPHQTIVLKPAAKPQIAPVAKADDSESDVVEPTEEQRPRPAVDMASALAEVEKNQQEASVSDKKSEPEPERDLEPMGTMGPAAALGLKAAPEPSGPSMDSVRRPTVTGKDPRTGKQQMLELEPVAKGRFDKAEPTVVDGEDLDIPTFLRKKKGSYT